MALGEGSGLTDRTYSDRIFYASIVLTMRVSSLTWSE